MIVWRIQEDMIAPWQATVVEKQEHPMVALRSRSLDTEDDPTVFTKGPPVAPLSDEEQTPLMGLLAKFDDPAFQVESLIELTNAQPLLCLVVYFANTYMLVDSLQLCLPTLQRFLTQIEAAYRPLPYHSNLHAADVVVTAMRLLNHSERDVSLLPLELLAIVISCAVHDVDHLGVNNAFLIATQHEIAVRHNDQ